MNNSNSNSSINLDPKLTLILLWIVSILASAGITTSRGFTTIIIVIASVLLLVYEKQNKLVRNHAGQVLVLNLAALIVSILVSSIFSVLVALVYWIPVLNVVTTVSLTIVLGLISLLFIALNILGLIKAINQKEILLPIIGAWGTMLEETLSK